MTQPEEALAAIVESYPVLRGTAIAYADHPGLALYRPDQRVTLSATATDPDETWYAQFEYSVNGGAWTLIGNGSTVASGGNSTRTWNTDALPYGRYQVRARSYCSGHGLGGQQGGATSSFDLAPLMTRHL